MHNPTSEHSKATMMILKHLKAAPGQGIYFTKHTAKDIEVSADADYGGCKDDMSSTTRYGTYPCRNLVTWRSKKQNVVSKSSAKAEVRALTLGLYEG